ncbi:MULTISPECIES: cupin [Mycobacteriaceae]|uniref:cupin n=1 Tax=Mycobacteriaceae TaxID=1762 RepID=UPI000800ED47|nr:MULTISPECIES: cupin [Mycobacteriaceae]MCK0174936.1 cupin [Mycolicibacterium sp. F2034L]OBB61414.1 cupin [Mycobacterium sp. 852013-51886_SCH5428379]
MMADTLSLKGIGDEQLDAARDARAGRAAHTVFGGRERTLRQTVLALTAGSRLDDHQSPGEATLVVLRGRIQLGTATGATEGAEGDYLVVPDEIHNLVAVEDSVVLLTVVARS